jgi:hypothetical protein
MDGLGWVGLTWIEFNLGCSSQSKKFGGRNNPSNHHCNRANKLGIKIFMKQTKGPVMTNNNNN